LTADEYMMAILFNTYTVTDGKSPLASAPVARLLWQQLGASPIVSETTSADCKDQRMSLPQGPQVPRRSTPVSYEFIDVLSINTHVL